MATLASAAKATALAGGPLRGPLSRTLARRGGSQPSVEAWLFWPGPDLNSVAPDPFDHAQTGITLTGVQFGATQGAGLVELGDSADYATASKQAQTVTAWSDTSITITANLGSLGPGYRWLFVTTGGALVSEGRRVVARRAAAFTDSLSPNITAAGADATTARLTAPTGRTTADFDAGRRVDDSATTPSTTTTTTDYTEHEWALEATSAAVATSTYEFRVVRADGTLLGDYPVTPEWTVTSSGGTGAGATDLALSATATGQREAVATAAATVALTTTGTGSRTALAAGTATVTLDATGTGQKLGAGSATVTLDATATGQRSVGGAGTAVLALDATATGQRVAVGAATATVALDASAAGHRTAIGAGTAAVALDAVGAGTATRFGAGTADLALAATATGQVEGNATGSGTAALAFDATGTGSRTAVGAGTAALAFDASAAVGGAQVGAGTAALDFTAAATGLRTAIGAGSATVAFDATGTGSGAGPATGAGTAALAFTATATGQRTAVGAGTATITFTVVSGATGWSWLLHRGGVLVPATARLGGVHPTTTDVT